MNTSIQAAVTQITVPFHGANLYLVNNGGEPVTPMKPIVEGMGLDWGGQHKKVDANKSRWGISIMEIPSSGGAQLATCILLRKLPAWLATIDPGRIKNLEVRARVIQYQNECDDVLWRYWTEGIAVNERMAFTVNPADILTEDQQETLRLMVKTMIERLPKEQRGYAATKTWSKLKAHFKVSYRQIPQAEFAEAVSIVTRTAADWEVVEEKNFSEGNLTNKNYFKEARSAFWEQVESSNISLNLAPDVEQKIVDGYLAGMLAENRWLLSFDHEGRFVLHPVPKDAAIMDMKELPGRIREAGNMALSEVAPIFEACAERMIASTKMQRRAA